MKIIWLSDICDNTNEKFINARSSLISKFKKDKNLLEEVFFMKPNFDIFLDDKDHKYISHLSIIESAKISVQKMRDDSDLKLYIFYIIESEDLISKLILEIEKINFPKRNLIDIKNLWDSPLFEDRNIQKNINLNVAEVVSLNSKIEFKSGKKDINMHAINFAIDHDDGKNVDSSILNADIIIIGPSRCGKTPVSFYLAYQNYLVANIPFFHGCDMSFLSNVEDKTIIGLTMEPKKLYDLREVRGIVDKKLSNANLPANNYSNMSLIIEEIVQSNAFYSKQSCYVIDTTSKSIEEVANRIIKIHLWRSSSTNKFRNNK